VKNRVTIISHAFDRRSEREDIHEKENKQLYTKKTFKNTDILQETICFGGNVNGNFVYTALFASRRSCLEHSHYGVAGLLVDGQVRFAILGRHAYQHLTGMR